MIIGRRETELVRCGWSDSEIQVWNTVGKDIYGVVDLRRYEKEVVRRLMGLVASVLRGEEVELPFILYGR